MENNINLIAFGTFGNPNGFQQTFFVGNKDLEKSIKTFDLNTNAIKLFPQSRVYSIRKEYANGYNAVAYSIYTFAKEQNSDRSGTFIGSSILYANKIADENITINCLNDFHNNLIKRHVQNDTINVNHSNSFSVSAPKDFDKLEFNLKKVEDFNFIQSSNKNLVTYCGLQPEKLQHLLKKAIGLLNVYDTIYFTDSSEVAEFVHQKGIFKLVRSDGFKQEVQNLHDERKRKTESSISDFLNEKQKLEDNRNKLLYQYKEDIERNEKLHAENEQRIKEAKSDLDKISRFYLEFAQKIDDFTNQLKSGRRPEEVKQLYNENQRIFIDSITNLKKPNFINSISIPKLKTEVRPSFDLDHYTHEPFKENNTYPRREDKVKPVKIIPLALVLFIFLLFSGTLAYLLFFRETEAIPTTESQPQKIQTSVAEKPTKNPSGQELSPKPNAELNENDYRLVATKIKYNTKVDEVIKIIFNNNPTDIQNSYSNQTKLYAKQLIELNENCFKEKDSVFFFVKDTLIHIPSFKDIK